MKISALSVLVSAVLLATTGEAAHLKQAKARDIAAHEKFADIVARAPPTISDGVCICPDNTPCRTGCGSDCGGSRQRRSAEPRDLFWIAPSEFSGEIYSAKVIAELIKGDGVFVHGNGSTVVDWEYKTNSEANRIAFWKNKRSGPGMMERIKRGFISFTAPYLAKTIAVYFDDPDKVFLLSENSGVANKDIIRMANALLEDKEAKDFMIWHHVIDRHTMETVVSTLCPRLGPMYCEN